MDNDQQIKDLASVTRERFLSQSLDADLHEENFDLEHEFAKAAKNRSFLVPIVCAAFLVVMLVSAWGATLWANFTSNQASVQIGQFNDLKLRDLFDRAKRHQQDLLNVRQEISQAEQASHDRIETLRQSARAKIELLSVEGLSPAVVDEKTTAIKDRLESQIFHERRSTEAVLVGLNQRATDLQNKIDDFNQQIGKINQQNQDQIDAQQHLFDLELQKTQKYYEDRLDLQARNNATALANQRQAHQDFVAALKNQQALEIRRLILKYNPLITEPDILSIVDAYQKAKTSSSFPVLHSGLFNDDAVSQTEALENKANELHKLLGLMRTIPYENSVPGVLNSVNSLTNESFDGFATLLNQSSAKIEQQGSELASQRSQNKIFGDALESILSASGKNQDGLVLNTKDPREVVIWVRPGLAVAVGDVFIVRNQENNDDLGTLTVTKLGPPILAQTTVQKNLFRSAKSLDRLELVSNKKP